MPTTSQVQIYGPPLSPITDEAWRRWFTEVVWPIIGAGVGNSGPQGTFPKLQIGTTTISPIGTPQAGLLFDQTVLVEVTDTRNAILYGGVFSIVGAASGASQVVGAQIDGTVSAHSGATEVWGAALEAIAYPNTATNIVGIEPAVVNFNDNAPLLAKWGVNPVFKDRTDTATASFNGLGSNYYNYFAEAVVLTAQARSTDGEFCGWNCGLDFLDGCLDTSTVPAWSSTFTYSPGMIVSSGGVLWKAIQTSLNQAPIAGSAYWVQHTYAGTTNLAVGIDFSSMSTTSMARMASAIRLRSSMYMHWDETGAVGTLFNATTSIHHVCDNQGNLRLGVDVGTGLIYTSIGTIAPGGGAGATLGTIGGTGPATAAQNSWGRMNFNGTTYFVPLWT